jgi:8-oxo-dGTP pyrophosphatase MutT (NUDIX family)
MPSDRRRHLAQGEHLDPVRETSVVTCFLLRTGPRGHDEVLILRRSGRVRTYRGRWAGVSGYLEGARTGARLGESPEARARPPSAEDQARREIQEETGLTSADIELLRAGDPLTFEDPDLDTRWTVYPFLFRVRPGATIAVDWEHTEARWVRPGTLGRYRTVPCLREALARVCRPGQGDRA